MDLGNVIDRSHAETQGSLSWFVKYILRLVCNPDAGILDDPVKNWNIWDTGISKK